jgi:hypothetical protein
VVCLTRPRKEIAMHKHVLPLSCCWPKCWPLPAAQAQDTAAIDQVTIVGSRARNRTVFDSAVPIDRFGAREVENALSSGEVGAALQALAPSINFRALNRAAPPTRCAACSCAAWRRTRCWC